METVKDRWLLGWGWKEEELVEHRFLGSETTLYDGHSPLHICPNAQNMQHQE